MQTANIFLKVSSSSRPAARHGFLIGIFLSILFPLTYVRSLCLVTDTWTSRQFLALSPSASQNSSTSTSRPWPSHEFLQEVIFAGSTSTENLQNIPPATTPIPSKPPTPPPATAFESGTHRSDTSNDDKNPPEPISIDNSSETALERTTLAQLVLKNEEIFNLSKLNSSKSAQFLHKTLNTTKNKPKRDYLFENETTPLFRTEQRPAVPLVIFSPKVSSKIVPATWITTAGTVLGVKDENPHDSTTTHTSGIEVPFKVVPPRKSNFPELTPDFYSKLGVLPHVVKQPTTAKPGDYVDDETLGWWFEQDPEPQETFPTKHPFFTHGTWPYTKTRSTTTTWATTGHNAPGWFSSTSTPPTAPPTARPTTNFPILLPSNSNNNRVTAHPFKFHRPTTTTKATAAPPPLDLTQLFSLKFPVGQRDPPEGAGGAQQTLNVSPMGVKIASETTTITADGDTSVFSQVYLTSSDNNETLGPSNILQKPPTNIWYKPIINHNYGSPPPPPVEVEKQNVTVVHHVLPDTEILTAEKIGWPTSRPSVQSTTSISTTRSTPTTASPQNRAALLFKLWRYSNGSLDLKVQKKLPSWLITVYGIRDDHVLNFKDLPFAIQRVALEQFSQMRGDQVTFGHAWTELPTLQEDSTTGGVKLELTGSAVQHRPITLNYIVWSNSSPLYGGNDAAKQTMQNYVQIILRQQGFNKLPPGTPQSLSIDDPETWNLLTLPLVLAALNMTRGSDPTPLLQPTTTSAPPPLKNIANLLSSQYNTMSQALGSILPEFITGQQSTEKPLKIPPITTKVTHHSSTETTVSYGEPTRRPRPRPPPPFEDDPDDPDFWSLSPYKSLLFEEGTTKKPEKKQTQPHSQSQVLTKKKGWKGWGWGGSGWGGWGGWDGWGDKYVNKIAKKLAKKYAPYLILLVAGMGPFMLLGMKKSKKSGGSEFHTHVYAPPKLPYYHGHHHHQQQQHHPHKGWAWSARHHHYQPYQPHPLQVKGDLQVYHHILNRPHAQTYYPPSSSYYRPSSHYGSNSYYNHHYSASNPQQQVSAPYGGSSTTSATSGYASPGYASQPVPSKASNVAATSQYTAAPSGVSYGGAVSNIAEFSKGSFVGQGTTTYSSAPQEPVRGWGWKDDTEAYLEQLKVLGKDVGTAIGRQLAKNKKKKGKFGKYKAIFDKKKNLISEMIGSWVAAEDRVGTVTEGAPGAAGIEVIPVEGQQES